MKKALSVILLAGLLGLGGWYYYNEIYAVPISKLLDNPRDYAGRNITIAGTVTERFSLLVVRYFNLRDASGDIMVVTDQPMPAVGTEVRVKGQVAESFSMGDQQVLVFVESKR